MLLIDHAESKRAHEEVLARLRRNATGNEEVIERLEELLTYGRNLGRYRFLVAMEMECPEILQTLGVDVRPILCEAINSGALKIPTLTPLFVKMRNGWGRPGHTFIGRLVRSRSVPAHLDFTYRRLPAGEDEIECKFWSSICLDGPITKWSQIESSTDLPVSDLHTKLLVWATRSFPHLTHEWHEWMLDLALETLFTSIALNKPVFTWAPAFSPLDGGLDGEIAAKYTQRHFRWLVLYQVKGLTAAEIGHKPTVEKIIRELCKLLDLPKRKRRCGPSPRSSVNISIGAGE